MNLKRINFTSGSTSNKDSWEALRILFSGKHAVQGYHDAIRRLMGCENVYSFTAGRMALYGLLKAIEVEPGDEVMLQGFTCAVVPKAVKYTGATPVYVDITVDGYNINYEDLLRKVTANTRVIIVQHTFGNPCRDIFKIKDFCQERGIHLLEDCAHTLGTEYEGRLLGTIGDASFFSTDHTKYISTSVGGFAIVNNDQLIRGMNSVYQESKPLNRWTCVRIALQLGLINGFTAPETYKLGRYFLSAVARTPLFFLMNDYGNLEFPTAYPFPAKLTDVQARVGILQLEGLQNNILHRKMITEIYQSGLRDIADLQGICQAPLRFPLRVRNRELWIREMKPVLAPESWFSPAIQGIAEENLHKIGYVKGCCPQAERAAGEIVNLPTHPKVTPEDAMTLVKRITDSDLRNTLL